MGIKNMKFKIINSDQGHNYTHYVDAPDKQTAMDRFNASHYGRIVDCEEVKPFVSLSEDNTAEPNEVREPSEEENRKIDDLISQLPENERKEAEFETSRNHHDLGKVEMDAVNLNQLMESEVLIINNRQYIERNKVESMLTKYGTLCRNKAIEEAVQKIDAYWRFDNHQTPMSSWHEKQDLISELNKLKV